MTAEAEGREGIAGFEPHYRARFGDRTVAAAIAIAND